MPPLCSARIRLEKWFFCTVVDAICEANAPVLNDCSARVLIFLSDKNLPKLTLKTSSKARPTPEQGHRRHPNSLLQIGSFADYRATFCAFFGIENDQARGSRKTNRSGGSGVQ